MAETVTAETVEPLFETAHSALVFAFNYSGQRYDRPTMLRLAAPDLGSGKGLGGLDGAAQAGMIRAEVSALGRLAESLIAARVAPRTVPCACRAACCCGTRPNTEWTNAIMFLADHVRTKALAGCVVNGVMRREYVVRYFTRRGERVSLENLADKHEVNRKTVSAHALKVAQYLGGVPARPGKQAVDGMEPLAMAAIEARLIAPKIVGNIQTG